MSANNNQRVYVDGVFDLFHLGHIRLLKRAKSYGQQLIVGIVTDKDAISYKRQPIIPYSIRRQTIIESGLADIIVEAQLVTTKEFIEKHNIDMIIHGDESKQLEFYQEAYDMGIMNYIPYTEEICTTKILEWIKQRQNTANTK